MKHSCNSHLGIKMDSNKHGAMEQNEEHIQTNKSIYYTPKTELRMQSYDAMNMPENVRDLGKKRGQP